MSLPKHCYPHSGLFMVANRLSPRFCRQCSLAVQAFSEAQVNFLGYTMASWRLFKAQFPVQIPAVPLGYQNGLLQD